VIRRWLLDRIPASHVPRAFSFRDSLPLTTAGKVDRSALVAELTVRSTR
jgi:acyl-CoA synthetase (AMP-forming)/AMP-acid ligase II